MIASILQCEYIKHGMTCELGGLGSAMFLALIAIIVLYGSMIIISKTWR